MEILKKLLIWLTEFLKSRADKINQAPPLPKLENTAKANIDIYRTAARYIGIQEILGSKHNSKILEMFKKAGHPEIKDDETSWCAAFVGAVLYDLGIEGTKSLLAKSYLEWGEAVSYENLRKGDIVVFWRNSPDSWTGHVGFYHDKTDNGDIMVLGGNQSNQVNISTYPKKRFLSGRRYKL